MTNVRAAVSAAAMELQSVTVTGAWFCETERLILGAVSATMTLDVSA